MFGCDTVCDKTKLKTLMPIFNADLTAWGVLVLYQAYTGGAVRRHDNGLLLCIPYCSHVCSFSWTAPSLTD